MEKLILTLIIILNFQQFKQFVIASDKNSNYCTLTILLYQVVHPNKLLHRLTNHVLQLPEMPSKKIQILSPFDGDLSKLKLHKIKYDHVPFRFNRSIELSIVRKYSTNCETIVFILGSQVTFDEFDEWTILRRIHHGHDPKNDKFIFVGSQLKVLETILNSRWVIKLKMRYGIYIDDLDDLDLDNLHIDKDIMLLSWPKLENIVLDRNNSMQKCLNEKEALEATSGLHLLKTFEQTSRENLCGQKLIVHAFVIDPYIMLKYNQPLGGYFYNGLFYSANAYNFTYDLDHPFFPGVVQLKNLTWTGGIADIVYGRKDMVLGSITNDQRFPYVDYPTHTGFTGLHFMTNHPKRYVHLLAILDPFRPIVWTMTVGTMFIVFVILAMTLNTKKTKWSDNIFRAFVIAFGTLVEQSATIPKNIRSLSIIWTLATIIILTFYKSNFTAHLSAPIFEKIPESYEELAKSEQYVLKLMNYNAADLTFFNQSKSPIYKTLLSRLVLTPSSFDNHLKCIQSSIFDKKTVCVGFIQFALNYIARNLTVTRNHVPVKISRESAVNFIMNVGFTRGSKYVQSFDSINGYLRDTGNTDKWVKDVLEYRAPESIEWLKESNEKNGLYQKLMSFMRKNFSNDYEPFDVSHVLFSFILWSIGLILSVSIFVSEVTVNRIKCTNNISSRQSHMEMSHSMTSQSVPNLRRALALENRLHFGPKSTPAFRITENSIRL